MITKIDLINMAQAQMASSIMPKDLRGRFSIPRVSRVINGCLEEIVKNDPIAKEETAQEYSLAVSSDDGYYISLQKKPILGASSFVYLMDGDKRILVTSKGNHNTFTALRGSKNKTAVLKGNRIYFASQPSGTNIIACYVANVNDMADSDIIVTNGAEKYILEGIVSVLRQSDIRPEDRINNKKVDVEN